MSMWWTKTSSIAIFSADIHLFISNQLLGLIFGDLQMMKGSTPTSNFVNVMIQNIKHRHFFSWYSLKYVKSAVMNLFGFTKPNLGHNNAFCWEKFILPYFHQFMGVSEPLEPLKKWGTPYFTFRYYLKWFWGQKMQGQLFPEKIAKSPIVGT